jgi:hypothetical protein
MRKKALQEQALVMKMLGSIHSPLQFTAHLNATALRTDWDATKGKTINYSFYMIVCLTQIMILLRQLLHSPSAVSNDSGVSLVDPDDCYRCLDLSGTYLL